MSQVSRVATCLGHTALAAVTGWSLKHLPNPTVTGSPLVYALLWCLLLYSLLGMIRYSHPEPGRLLCYLYDRTALIAKVCPLPFLTAQLYLQPDPDETSEWFLRLYKSSLGYTFLLSALAAYVVCCIFSELHQRHIGDHVSTAVLLVNAVGLGIVSCGTGNYWATGQIVSYVSKHFLLPTLADRYRMPNALLYTYGLIFYEVFAVNAIIDSQVVSVLLT